MVSTPPAMMTSASPSLIIWAPETMACMAELHWRWTVKAGTLTGKPIFKAAVRAVLGSSVRWMQCPRITSSTISLPTFARFSASSIGKTASWCPRKSFSEPPKSPMAVRAPPMM